MTTAAATTSISTTSASNKRAGGYFNCSGVTLQALSFTISLALASATVVPS